MGLIFECIVPWMMSMLTNSTPFGAELVADLTEEQRAAVQQALDGLLHQRAGGSGPAVLRTSVHVGIGTT